MENGIICLLNTGELKRNAYFYRSALMRNIEKLRDKIRPVSQAPSLRRVNGWGCSIVGRYKDPEIEPLYYALYAFTVVWIPLLPIQIYIVSGDFSGYRFWATISVHDFAKLYPNGVLRLGLSCVVESVLWVVGVVLFLLVFAGVVTLLRGNYRCFWYC
jgi:hypothetical protein